MTDNGFSTDSAATTRLTIADRSFRSRVMLGTGKYRSPEIMAACHHESGAEIITVAVRRVNLGDRQSDSILSHLTGHSYFLLPNTAGCRTATEAVRTADLAREAGFSNWIKLEVIGDDQTLFPDNEGRSRLQAFSPGKASSYCLTRLTILSMPANSLMPALRPSCRWGRRLGRTRHPESDEPADSA